MIAQARVTLGIDSLSGITSPIINKPTNKNKKKMLIVKWDGNYKIYKLLNFIACVSAEAAGGDSGQSGQSVR